MSDLDVALAIFLEEAQTLLSSMEDALLALEDDNNDSEIINTLFRAMHTIKGSSGMFGFSHVVSFTHEAETVLDKVREGSQVVDHELISILLDCRDHTENLIQFCIEFEMAELPDEISEIGIVLVDKLLFTQGIIKSNAQSDCQISADNLSETESAKHWIISLLFQNDAFRMGVDPLSFVRYLKTIGEIHSLVLTTPDMPLDENFDPESCYLHFEIAFLSSADKQTIEDVFEFAADDCDISILPPSSNTETYLALLDTLPDDEVSRIGEMLIQIGALTKNDISHAVKTQHEHENPLKPIGEILVEKKVIQTEVIEKALIKQQVVKQKVFSESNYIRVDSQKLGLLINLVGELVIAGAAMDLMIEKNGFTEAEEVSANISSLVGDIRDTALELRMVPIGETFSRFKRVVRDVSKELGKTINLAITGAETELDKTVVEKMNDPLTHLIRNSLDHGIESPDIRIAAGKPENGTISLNAYHESGRVVIQITDDGAGLNKDKIREKAIIKGIISETALLSDQEIYNLIFAAGLSTKVEANDLSGRGVGMDVVKRNIEALRGNVTIDSEVGVGTSITIDLPLTLAIIDGFMVEANNERYIIPLSMIDECVEMNDSDWKENEAQHYINLRGSVMPYLRLADYFNPEYRSKNSKRQSLVVVKSGKQKAGFVVDQLHGEQQTVIKPLGDIFKNVTGLSGATVLGDGNVALILDVSSLIEKVTKASPPI
ncbi:MAG: chemotaxis protein CheA [Psychromonas sp.]|nr:chemotaxis protein CheA [Psychromonas sp.]